MKDRELDELLSKWQPEMPEEPGFQRSVWMGIETGGKGFCLRERLQRIAEWLTTPAVGIPVAAVVLALAAVLAIHNGKASRDRVWFDLASSYERSIAPDRHLYEED